MGASQPSEAPKLPASVLYTESTIIESKKTKQGLVFKTKTYLFLIL